MGLSNATALPLQSKAVRAHQNFFFCQENINKLFNTGI